MTDKEKPDREPEPTREPPPPPPPPPPPDKPLDKEDFWGEDHTGDGVNLSRD